MTQAIDMPSQRDRLVWLDYAKAIGIVLVVFGHASRSIGRTVGLDWSSALQSLDGVIYTFHMPLFFLLAGYAAQLQPTPETSKFVRSLWWGIAVPYIVWSAVWIGLKVLWPQAANVPLEISALGNILWQPVEHFWFLYHLFFIRAGWYATTRLSGQRQIPALALIIVTAAVAAILRARSLDLDWIAGFFRNFSIYGVGLVWLPMLLQVWNERPMARLAVLGAALCLWGFAAGEPSAILWQAIGGAFIVSGIAMALPAPASRPLRVFAFLGEASLAIYVMHLVVGAAVRAVLSKTGLLTEASLLVTATSAGIILPAVAYWLVLSAGQRWDRPHARWAGLGTAMRSTYLPLWPAAQPSPRVSSS